MKRTIKDARAATLVSPKTHSYEVGYGKPPTATRFEPGQSGNPRGRPKGRRSKSQVPDIERLKSIILGEAYRTIKVNDGDRQVSISMAQAIVRSLAISAAKGQARSQRLFAELLRTTEREMKAGRDEWLKTAIEYKVDWENELERRKQLGIVLPDPIPHPDHIEIDFNTDQVFIKGPMTKKQKATWDRLRKRLSECDRAIAEFEAMLKNRKNKKTWPIVQEELEFERDLRAKLVAAVG